MLELVGQPLEHVKSSQITLLTFFYFLQATSSFFNVVDRVYYQYAEKG